jgi:hypothetical protein
MCLASAAAIASGAPMKEKTQTKQKPSWAVWCSSIRILVHETVHAEGHTEKDEKDAREDMTDESTHGCWFTPPTPRHLQTLRTEVARVLRCLLKLCLS